MVISFLAVYVGLFVALEAVIIRLVSWVLDSGLFWYVAAPVGTAILMANLNG